MGGVAHLSKSLPGSFHANSTGDLARRDIAARNGQDAIDAGGIRGEAVVLQPGTEGAAGECRVGGGHRARIRRVERGSEVIEQAGLVAGEIGHSCQHGGDIARTDVVEQG